MNINIKIEKETRNVTISKNIIGNDGENLQGDFIFTFDDFVDGQAMLFYEIDGESRYDYLKKENETYVLPIKTTITKQGTIPMQLVIYENMKENEVPIFKTNVFKVKVGRSIEDGIEQPEEYPSWLEIANTKLNEFDNLDISIKDGVVTITKKDGTTESENVKGEPNILTIGEVVTGDIANATITGEAPNQILNLTLPRGDKGEKGDKGDKGDTGSQGIQGPRGLQGPEGPKGDRGEQGVQGKQGERGPQGAKGEKGDKGDANTLTIGSVTKGDEAQATITGEAPNQILNLVLPKGDKGDKAVTLEKINPLVNIIDTAESIDTNKYINGYNTSTYKPTMATGEGYSVVTFDMETLPEVVKFYVSDKWHCLLFYTENSKQSLHSRNQILENALYDPNTNEFTIVKSNFGYEKVAINLKNDYLYVHTEDVDTEFNEYLLNKQKININNTIGVVTGDKTDIGKFNLFDYAKITKKVQCTGYNTTTYRPILTPSSGNYGATIKLSDVPPTLLNNLYYKVPTLKIESAVQCVVLYKENTRAGNITRNALLNSSSYDNNTGYVKLNDVIADFSDYDYLFFVCDYENELKIYSTTFDSNNPNFKYIPILPYDYTSDIAAITAYRYKVVAGKDLLIYPQNITKNFDTKKANMIVIKDFTYNFDDVIILNSNTVRTFNTELQFYLNNTKKLNFKKYMNIEIVPTTAGNGLNKKVLFIGDSLTDAELYEQKVVELFNDDVMNIELIGTLGSGSYKNEGRGGWRAYTYAKCANGSDDVAGLSYTNPFYNPNTKSFDFSYYMNNNQFNSVDYVFINLGTNDVGRSNNKTETEIIGYYNTMINSIKAYNPNVKIGLWLPPARGIGNNINGQIEKNNALIMNEYLLKNFSDKESQNIYLIPTNVAIDPINDYNTSERTIDSTHSIVTITDSVHPKASGYNKIGDVLYYWIKYFGSLDE